MPTYWEHLHTAWEDIQRLPGEKDIFIGNMNADNKDIFWAAIDYVSENPDLWLPADGKWKHYCIGLAEHIGQHLVVTVPVFRYLEDTYLDEDGEEYPWRVLYVAMVGRGFGFGVRPLYYAEEMLACQRAIDPERYDGVLAGDFARDLEIVEGQTS